MVEVRGKVKGNEETAAAWVRAESRAEVKRVKVEIKVVRVRAVDKVPVEKEADNR